MIQLANAMKVMNTSQLSRLQSETKVENVQNNYIDIEANRRSYRKNIRDPIQIRMKKTQKYIKSLK